MSDALDDLVALRLAGYYDAGKEDPDDPMTWPEQVHTARTAIEASGEPLLTPEQLDAERHERRAGPHPHAAQPGNMPALDDIVDRMHRAEARVSVLELESKAKEEVIARLRYQLRGRTFDAPPPREQIEVCALIAASVDTPEASIVLAWLDANAQEDRP